ncbi:MAG: TonB family protein [Opitutales bacterium]|nr:TonB family protein [Opitutales bacterium]
MRTTRARDSAQGGASAARAGKSSRASAGRTAARAKTAGIRPAAASRSTGAADAARSRARRRFRREVCRRTNTLRRSRRSRCPQKFYPKAARRNGRTGPVFVRVSISGDGEISGFSVEKSSAHKSLVSGAEETLRRVAEDFSAPAGTHAALPAAFVVPIIYELN